MTKTLEVPKSSNVKIYTDEEIDNLSLEQLEKFAANLEWRGSRYDRWGSRKVGGIAKYRTSGFPSKYSNKTITDRIHFLRERLKSSRQETWNAEAKLAIKKAKEAEKKRLEAIEAKKPKVRIKTQVVIELKDHRPKGHTFIIKRENGQIKAEQKHNSEKSYKNENAYVGRTICSAQGNYSAQDFQDAVDLICSLEMPKIESKSKGKAKLNISASVVLEGSHNLNFVRNNGVVGIYQEDRYADRNRKISTLKDTDWQFNVADLLAVIKAMNTKYVVTEEVKKA